MKPAVDYSERAITMRLRQVSQLRKLCLSLARARPVESCANSQTTDNPARQRGD